MMEKSWQKVDVKILEKNFNKDSDGTKQLAAAG